MNTKCYCVLCKRHPLYKNNKKWKNVYAGFDIGKFIPKEFDKHGKDVECLHPVSSAFDELDLDPDDFKWEGTAYGDGCSLTFVNKAGYTIMANCGSEEQEE